MLACCSMHGCLQAMTRPSLPTASRSHTANWPPQAPTTPPAGPKAVEDREDSVLLGHKTIDYEAIREGFKTNLEPNSQGYVSWRALWHAVCEGGLVLRDEVRRQLPPCLFVAGDLGCGMLRVNIVGRFQNGRGRAGEREGWGGARCPRLCSQLSTLAHPATPLPRSCGTTPGCVMLTCCPVAAGSA